MLDTAQRCNPDCNWWLKGDGCDLVSGLGESMHLQWSGDVDLNTGNLQQEYESYRSLLNFISSLSLDVSLPKDLQKCSHILLEEKEFLVKGVFINLFKASCLKIIFCSPDRC